MTGKSTQQGKPERLESSVVELVGAMRRIAGLMNSGVGRRPDGSLSEVGQVCSEQLKAAETELIGPETTPASFEDLAALTAYAKAHCVLGAQAARELDPLLAAEHMELALAVLGKTSTQLETITGVATVDLGLGFRLN
jgi:hypothetical protein